MTTTSSSVLGLQSCESAKTKNVTVTLTFVLLSNHDLILCDFFCNFDSLSTKSTTDSWHHGDLYGLSSSTFSHIWGSQSQLSCTGREHEVYMKIALELQLETSKRPFLWWKTFHSFCCYIGVISTNGVFSVSQCLTAPLLLAPCLRGEFPEQNANDKPSYNRGSPPLRALLFSQWVCFLLSRHSRRCSRHWPSVYAYRL